MDFFDDLKEFPEDEEKVVDKKKKKKKGTFSIFDFIKALTSTKEDLTEHPDFEKDYNPFRINRWLSMDPTLIYASFFANKTDIISNKKLHFLFLQNTIEKGNYYISYKKDVVDNPDVKIISEYYNVNEAAAREYLLLLSIEEINKIKDTIGGKV